MSTSNPLSPLSCPACSTACSSMCTDSSNPNLQLLFNEHSMINAVLGWCWRYRPLLWGLLTAVGRTCLGLAAGLHLQAAVAGLQRRRDCSALPLTPQSWFPSSTGLLSCQLLHGKEHEQLLGLVSSCAHPSVGINVPNSCHLFRAVP